MNVGLRLCGIIVCFQFDDSAVLKSPKGTLPVSGSLSLVIYENPQSICDINFANECQNDVVLGSFDISHCNVLHGSGSEACSLPVEGRRKIWSKSGSVFQMYAAGLNGLVWRKADCAITALRNIKVELGLISASLTHIA